LSWDDYDHVARPDFAHLPIDGHPASALRDTIDLFDHTVVVFEAGIARWVANLGEVVASGR
jgi:hypothetical protein